MISIPRTSTAPSTLPLSLSLPHNAVPLRFLLYHHRHRRRQLTPRLTISNPSPSSSDPQWRRQQQQKPPRESAPTLFPGGYKRPEVRVPAIVLKVSAAEVLEGESSRNAIDLALAKGVVGVVLLTGDGEGGGGRLYEAAGVVRALVGDRAYLMVDERVDVAAAVGAGGVVLSNRGLPPIIARGMMSKSAGQSVLLPLVARYVQTMDDAVSASSSEGADFLIISTDREMYAKIVNEFGITPDIRIPIFFDVVDLIVGDSLYNTITRLLQLGASGMVLSLDHLQVFTDDILGLFQNKHIVNGRKPNSGSYSNKPVNSGGTKELYEKQMIAGFTKLNDGEIQFVEAERNVLLEAVTVIRNAAPLMEQISLLLDAIERLDQPFLMVIVGEFNSGKSTVINALLGRQYLKDGVVPTTNEITLLCYSEKESFEQERCKRHPDGQYICHLHAPILKEMNLVDTPGTNVILQRQQRLTEEYVPRADLVLFVLSSDRPLTESEIPYTNVAIFEPTVKVEFLLYIQQWKKKVVFLLNKSDLYRNTSELEEAMEFVKGNIRTILNAEVVEVYPVSARIAAEAKLCVSSDIGQSEVALKNNPLWRSSGFHELENYLFSFLDGSTDTGMERMKLKLETPIGITDRLLAACEIRIKQDYELARKDLTAINELVNSVKDYAIKMENESASWKNEMLLLIETAKTRAIKLVESILQLSNIDVVATYAFRGENSSSVSATSAIQNEIISPALSDAQKFLGEYLQWLETSSTCESQQYYESFNQRWPGLIGPSNRVHHDSNTLFKKLDVLCIEVARSFSPSAAARLFDQEIREVVLGTYGGLGVAGLSASLLTSVLPTTLEDLIALALCSAGGFFAISQFPARRNNAIQKVTKVADALAKEIEEAMQEDLSKTVDSLRNFVELTSKPYQEAAQRKMDKLSETQGELSIVQQKLQALKMEIQNLRLL